jgi:hypothetical protein
MVRKGKERIQILGRWIAEGLQRYTKDQPLLVAPLRNTRELTVFTDAERQLYFAEGGAIRKRAWQELSAEVRGAIIVSALREVPRTPSPEVLRGAEAYAYVHGLPEMIRALGRAGRSGAR